MVKQKVCLLYFFAILFLIASVLFLSTPKNVYSEADTIFVINNDNKDELRTYLNENIDKKINIRLEADLSFESWQTIEYFSGVFDGNGFKITIDAPLFKTIKEGAVIKNLGVIAAEGFSFDNSGNFGVIAQNASNSTKIENCYVNGSLGINVKSSSLIDIGGFIGFANHDTIIKNSYAQIKIHATQSSPEFISTNIGGLVGTGIGIKITNSYVCPLDSQAKSKIIFATIQNSHGKTLNIGGLVGYAEKSSNGELINNFVAGMITTSYPEDKIEEYFGGKLIGYAKDNYGSSLSHCYYSYKAGEDLDLPFIGNINDTIVSSYKIENCYNDVFSTLKNYESNNIDMWDPSEPWLTNDQIWYKCDELGSSLTPYLTLQVFDNFSVMTSPRDNDAGITAKLQIYNKDLVGYVDTSLTSFKYGTKLEFEITVDDGYKDYKKIQFLQKTDGTKIDLTGSHDENDDESEGADGAKTVYYDFIVDKGTSGSYFATGKNIVYKLKIITQGTNEGTNKGKIKTGSAPITRNEVEGIMELDGTYSYTAIPNDIAYEFSRWVWVVDENDHEKDIQVIRGKFSDNYPAQQTISISFGKNGEDSDITYVTIDKIPFNAETKTFTLMAEFGDNLKDLEIGTNSSLESCSLKVDGIVITDEYVITDWTSIKTLQKVANRTISITIEPKEGFVFDYWSTVGGKNLENYIDKNNGESKTSMTINLKIKDDFILIAHLSQIDVNEVDLTWLWWSLGGVGGAGLITLLVFAIIHRRKRETFLPY